MSTTSDERGRYPAHRETDVVLRDGGTVHIRPARAEDRERVEDYLIGLSDESRRLRFWGLSVDITDVAARAVDVDYVDHLTLLAFEGGPDGTVVGGAQYMREAGTPRAEVSVSVADVLQGLGLGSILIAHLAQAAQSNDLETFVAQVLPENHRMIDVFRRTGFEVHIRAVPGEVQVEFPTEITDEAASRYEAREDSAAAAAVRLLLEPASIAVVGASRDPSSTVATSERFLPDEASLSDPVDMIASASPDDYGRAIAVVAVDPSVDAMIGGLHPAPRVRRPGGRRGDGRGDRRHRGPHPGAHVLHVVERAARCAASARGRIPSFAYPEQAAIALAHATELGVWRAKPEGRTPSFDVREDEAAAVIADALTRGKGWLTPEETGALLDCYGVPTARQSPAASPEEAAKVAASFGGPIALKAIGLVHKTEAGAVVLDVQPDEVGAAAAAMTERIRASAGPLDGFLVQQMVAPGVEMLVGAVSDPVFGPVIAVGAGGVMVELTRDLAVRVAPLTDLDADEMVRSLATFPLLDGFRGAPKADVRALTDVVLRLGALVTVHDAIAEMDCNPVIVHEEAPSSSTRASPSAPPCPRSRTAPPRWRDSRGGCVPRGEPR